MGMSPSAHLAYGHHLGCPGDGGWDVEEADEYGGVNLPWFSSEGDVRDALMCRILRGTGLTDAQNEEMGWWKRQTFFPQRTGLRLLVWGHHETPRYLLVVEGSILTAEGYEAVEVPPLYMPADSDQRLRLALRNLEVTPRRRNPLWLLCPAYG